MSSLLTAIQSAGHALLGFEKAIGVVQSNVLNASTPGYARMQLRMTAAPFNPDAGMYGGLETADIESARNSYAEQSVWQQTALSSYYGELSTALGPLQGAFDLTGATGISKGLNAMFDAFSAWSRTPNDATIRQNVISAAGNLATQFQLTYNQLAGDGESMRRQVDSLVSKVNSLAGDIARSNQAVAASQGTGAIADSRLYADLEELSGLVNVSYVQASDGTYTVLLDGQVPLVVGGTTYHIMSSTTPNAAGIPAIEISSSDGPITSHLTGGRLGAQLAAYNGTLTSLLGGATATGSLNDLASAIATTVNNILQGGETAGGVAGMKLFADIAAGTPAASVISLNPITAADLGAVDSATHIGNGIPLALAALATAPATVGTTTNVSYTDYLASLAQGLGRQISSANAASQQQAQLLSQAKSLRSNVSGVSLDEEAAQLTAIQQSYQATARVFTVVNQMLDTLMNLIRQ